ncbi:unnamed protein product [Amoebophrya sp. A120]|nr:unnamed protein product [Amoebophrya sp. A120]|eukprot:GSA120T00024365001.1
MKQEKMMTPVWIMERRKNIKTRERCWSCCGYSPSSSVCRSRSSDRARTLQHKFQLFCFKIFPSRSTTTSSTSSTNAAASNVVVLFLVALAFCFPSAATALAKARVAARSTAIAVRDDHSCNHYFHSSHQQQHDLHGPHRSARTAAGARDTRPHRRSHEWSYRDGAPDPFPRSVSPYRFDVLSQHVMHGRQEEELHAADDIIGAANHALLDDHLHCDKCSTNSQEDAVVDEQRFSVRPFRRSGAVIGMNANTSGGSLAMQEVGGLTTGGATGTSSSTTSSSSGGSGSSIVSTEDQELRHQFQHKVQEQASSFRREDALVFPLSFRRAATEQRPGGGTELHQLATAKREQPGMKRGIYDLVREPHTYYDRATSAGSSSDISTASTASNVATSAHGAVKRLAHHSRLPRGFSSLCTMGGLDVHERPDEQGSPRGDTTTAANDHGGGTTTNGRSGGAMKSGANDHEFSSDVLDSSTIKTAAHKHFYNPNEDVDLVRTHEMEQRAVGLLKRIKRTAVLHTKSPTVSYGGSTSSGSGSSSYAGRAQSIIPPGGGPGAAAAPFFAGAREMSCTMVAPAGRAAATRPLHHAGGRGGPAAGANKKSVHFAPEGAAHDAVVAEGPLEVSVQPERRVAPSSGFPVAVDYPPPHLSTKYEGCKKLEWVKLFMAQDEDQHKGKTVCVLDAESLDILAATEFWLLCLGLEDHARQGKVIDHKITDVLAPRGIARTKNLGLDMFMKAPQDTWSTSRLAPPRRTRRPSCSIFAPKKIEEGRETEMEHRGRGTRPVELLRKMKERDQGRETTQGAPRDRGGRRQPHEKMLSGSGRTHSKGTMMTGERETIKIKNFYHVEDGLEGDKKRDESEEEDEDSPTSTSPELEMNDKADDPFSDHRNHLVNFTDQFNPRTNQFYSVQNRISRLIRRKDDHQTVCYLLHPVSFQKQFGHGDFDDCDDLMLSSGEEAELQADMERSARDHDAKLQHQMLRGAGAAAESGDEVNNGSSTTQTRLF